MNTLQVSKVINEVNLGEEPWLSNHGDLDYSYSMA